MSNITRRNTGEISVSCFRCYALDHNGRIIGAEDVEAADAHSAVDLGRQFVASRQIDARDALQQQGIGLEIWQGVNLVFTTLSGDYPRR